MRLFGPMDDEALARQLQADEFAQANQHGSDPDAASHCIVKWEVA